MGISLSYRSHCGARLCSCVLLNKNRGIKSNNLSFLHIINSISSLTDSVGKITACHLVLKGTDCVSKLGRTGATNCVSKSFPSSLSKQLINKITNSVCSKEEERVCYKKGKPDPANVKVWIVRIDLTATVINYT